MNRAAFGIPVRVRPEWLEGDTRCLGMCAVQGIAASVPTDQPKRTPKDTDHKP